MNGSAARAPGAADFTPVRTPVSALKPHPRNYRGHPEDQLAHLCESIKEHGLYRNVIAARDGTILAGHGVVAAAERLGLAAVPVVRLDLDPGEPRALKILTGDNEVSRLGEVDDRALSELLKQIKDTDDAGLLGTGWDDMMLANLVYVTRPAGEVRDFDDAAEWVGMPDYAEGERNATLVVNFRSRSDREEFTRKLGLAVDNSKGAKSTWWPPKEGNRDLKSVLFDG